MTAVPTDDIQTLRVDAAPPPKTESRRKGRPGLPLREKVLFVAPAFLLVLGLYLTPLLLNAGLSLFRWTAFRPDISWFGLGNYADLNAEGLLVPTVARTLVYAAVSATLLVVAPLLLALALERGTRLNRVLRTVFFAPVLLSPLAVGFTFTAILGLNGVVNAGLSLVLGRSIQIPWLASTNLSLIVVAVAVAWRWAPLVFVVFVAALATVPRELVEAATLDGAGWWSLIRHVKLPLLAPAITFSVVIALVTSLSAYETVLVLTGGGPGRSTQVLNFLVIIQFGQGRYGSAAALSTVLYGAIFLSCLPLVILLRRREVQL